MSRDFTKVSPAVWRSKRFKSASSEGRLLYFYLLTSEHQNNAGCHRLPPGYACADLGWSADEFETARSELVTLGLIEFDPETEEVFLPRFLKHSPPANHSHLKGIRRTIGSIESDRLRAMAEAELDGDRSSGDPLGPADIEPSYSPHSPYAGANGRLANTPLAKRARADA